MHRRRTRISEYTAIKPGVYVTANGDTVSSSSYSTRGSADADNRLDAFSGQSRSTNMVPFHM